MKSPAVLESTGPSVPVRPRRIGGLYPARLLFKRPRKWSLLGAVAVGLQEGEHMLVRMMRSRLWAASLLVVGLGMITVACGSGASTSASGITSPALTPSPSPTATITIAPTATATSVAIAGCSASSSPYEYYENPPGPLPTTMPLPPGTLVDNIGLGISAGSVSYILCTPTMTSGAITAYMESALPAAGWLRNSVAACNAQSYPWYKGKYGMEIDVDVNPPMPHLWALQICPHVGED